MKTKFLIDAKVEAENIPHLMRLSGRRVLFPAFAKRIINKKGDELYKEVVKIHEEYKEEIKKLKENSEKNWKKIEKDYFKEMEKITGYRLKKDKCCYFAPTIIGVADVRGRKNVFIGLVPNESFLNYEIFHELTHLHYADIIERTRLYGAGQPPLIEIADHFLLFKSPINKLINSQMEYQNIKFTTRLNPEFMLELEEAWEKRENFESFIKEAIKIEKKFKKMKILQ